MGFTSALKGLNRRGMQQVWRRGEVYTGFWWGDLKETDLLEEPGVDGRIISIPILPTHDKYKLLYIQSSNS
jgi:hypothetical protein